MLARPLSPSYSYSTSLSGQLTRTQTLLRIHYVFFPFSIWRVYPIPPPRTMETLQSKTAARSNGFFRAILWDGHGTDWLSSEIYLGQVRLWVLQKDPDWGLTFDPHLHPHLRERNCGTNWRRMSTIPYSFQELPFASKVIQAKQARIFPSKSISPDRVRDVNVEFHRLLIFVFGYGLDLPVTLLGLQHRVSRSTMAASGYTRQTSLSSLLRSKWQVLYNPNYYLKCYHRHC